MGQQQPLPDRTDAHERELERFFAGEDEEASRGRLLELRQRYDDLLKEEARRRCGGDVDLAMDAMQELDVRLREKRKRYNPERGRWIDWAKQVLRNIVNDMFRKFSRLPGSLPPTRSGSASGDPLDHFPEAEHPAGWRIKQEELQAAMNGCLKTLPADERDALILYVVEDLTLQEVADSADVVVSTAKKRVDRAREKMQACLKRKGYQGDDL
jgi:RNA polymerase sigma factor (sigma-70 family)